jgi:hypothetical protein
MRVFACFLGLAAVASGPAVAQQRPAPPVQPRLQQPAPAPVQPGPVRLAPAPAGPVMPIRMTARSLTAICNENQGACLTYVLGAVDAFDAASVVNFGRVYICLPPQVTNQQIANVAIAFLRAHPEAQDANAGLVVIQGVRASYPCP